MLRDPIYCPLGYSKYEDEGFRECQPNCRFYDKDNSDNRCLMAQALKIYIKNNTPISINTEEAFGTRLSNCLTDGAFRF